MILYIGLRYDFSLEIVDVYHRNIYISKQNYFFMVEKNILLRYSLIEDKDLGKIKPMRGSIDTFRAGGTDMKETLRSLSIKVLDYLLSSPYNTLIADKVQFESAGGVTTAKQKVFFLSGGFEQLNDPKYDGLSVDDFRGAMGLAGVLVS